MALFSRTDKKITSVIHFAPIVLEQARNDERYAVWIQNHCWTSRNEKWCRAQMEKFTYRPSIGILMQCVNPKEELLRQSLASIFNQIYPFSELSVVDRGSVPQIRTI